MPDTLRAFIAVPVPASVAGFLNRVQAQLNQPGNSIRWVPVGNIHLTLKFLGDVERSRIGAIIERMDAVAGSIETFSLQASGAGAFPGIRQARVLWVGIRGDVDDLRALQSAMASTLTSLGFEIENRPFRAHLTIGRPRRRLSPSVGEAMQCLKPIESEPFQVSQVNLYQSILKPTGAVYNLLHAASLETSGG